MAFPRMRTLLPAALVATVATGAAAASHADLACGRFAAVPSLKLSLQPTGAFELRTIELRARDVVLNDQCVSRRARVRRPARGGARFVAIFDECDGVHGIKVRGRTDKTCSTMRGQIVTRTPRSHSAFLAISGEACGRDGVCAAGSFCELPPGVCATDRLAGACVLFPDVCPDVFAPVCGCDGATYGNDCERQAAGVSAAHDGPCDTAGCFENAECGPDAYCAKPAGQCQSAGQCHPRAVLPCPLGPSPVCGCDGETYDSACAAASVGVNVAHEGACEQRCGTIAGLSCPDGAVCDLEPGMCNGADLGGVCVPKPEVCPEIYAPVCGCDGVTYGNDCERVAAEAQKDHDGACGACVPIDCPDGTRPHDSNQDGCDDECVPQYACFNDEDCVRVSPDLYCRFEDGMCGGAGECREVPKACSTVVDPVCGCDGVTYINDCEAALHSQLLHRGPCEPTCGTVAGISCPDGYVCDLDAGSCSVADAGGHCVEQPGMCPDDNYFPVCGCDGVTYDNDCKRLAAGVTKAHGGACTCGTCSGGSVPVDTSGDGCPDVCIGPPCTTQCTGSKCTLTCTATPPA